MLFNQKSYPSVIRSRKPKKDKQKTGDWATRTPLKTEVNSCTSEE